MANYQTRSKKIDVGRYQLSYGKGRKKLTCTIWFNDLANGWCISEGDGSHNDDISGPYGRKKDLVNAWGQWAADVYGEADAESSEPKPVAGQPAESTPAAPARRGPPKHKPSLKEKGPPKRKRPPKNLEFQFGADPFDGRFKYPSDHPKEGLRQKHTPLGVLVEIEQWTRRYEKQIKGVSAFQPLIASVRECIAREAPDLVKENDDGEPETDEAHEAAEE